MFWKETRRQRIPKSPSSRKMHGGSVTSIRRGLLALCFVGVSCIFVTLPSVVMDAPTMADDPLALRIMSDDDHIDRKQKKPETLKSKKDSIEAFNGTSKVSIIEEPKSLRDGLPSAADNASQVLFGTAPQQLRRGSDDTTNLLPSLIGHQVFMLDVVWLPHQSEIVLLALAPRMFRDMKVKEQSKAFNLTFPYEDLKPPTALLPQLSWNQKPIQSCQYISTESKFGGNISNKLFIVRCKVEATSSTSAHLRYQDTEVARFNKSRNTFNTARSMVFDRVVDVESSGGDFPPNSPRLSILIQPVSNYSPLFPDLLDYYFRQGVRHVYVGLIRPDEQTYDAYRRASDRFPPGFVSYGWFDSTDVGFNYNVTRGHILLKTMFSNSVLYHAKTAGDDLLMVVDIDEVPSIMQSTESTSLASSMAEQVDNETCYGVLHSHISWSYGQKESERIGERFPLRCDALNGYIKSVAVVKNCGFVGVHTHAGCVEGTKRKDFGSSKVAIHHYTSWWGKIRQRCPDEVESEIAKFQKEPVVASTRN